MVLGLSVTAYPVYIHWSRGMQQKLSATGEEQIYAQDSGLSETMPDGMTQAAAAKNESTEESAVYDSAAAGFSAVNGVTISVEQTVIDSNSARIALRIEGFMLPDGAYPDIGPGWQLTFGGERATNMTGGFVEGRDAEDRLIFTDTDGSLEFDFHASDTRTGFSFEGKEISLVIDSLGTGDKGQYEPLVEGPWELHWTPVGNGDLRSMQTDLPVGNTGLRLLSAELAPVSAEVMLKLPLLWEGYKTLESYELQLVGVRLQNGEVLTNIYGPPVEEGYADIDNLVLKLSYTSHKIVRPDQVDALLFAANFPWARELKEEELIIVPLE